MVSFTQSALLINVVLACLQITFVVKVTQSVLNYLDAKVARSTKDMFDKYVKFPTIDVCMGIDHGDLATGFEHMGTRPINETLYSFEFVQHKSNE